MYSSTHTSDLETRYRQVEIVMPHPLFPWRRNHHYPLDKRLVGPQDWSGMGECRKSYLLLSRKKEILSYK